MDTRKIKKFDKQKMLNVYDEWPVLAEKAYNQFTEIINLRKTNHLIFSGMGGSGAIGDVFSSILSKTNTHVTIVKGYRLPNTVNKNSIVIVISVSGNTSETISIIEQAHKKKCQIIAFSSGGRIRDICKRKKILYYNIEMRHSPRASFVIYLFSLLKILKRIINVDEIDIIKSIDNLKKQQKLISSKNLEKNNALKMAKWIKGIPIIYYPYGLQSVAIRFKNCLQENGKTHSIVEDVTEACHNGIVAWEKKSIVTPILLEGKNDFVKTKETWIILKKFFKRNSIEFNEIISIKGNILPKIINLIYFLDYVTIYYAIENNIDPTPVKSIEYIKKNIAN